MTTNNPAQLRALVERQLGICYYCGEDFCPESKAKRPTVDHKRPLCRGGRGLHGNKVAACYGCNHMKGALLEEEFWDVYTRAWQRVEDRRARGRVGNVEVFRQLLAGMMKARLCQVHQELIVRQSEPVGSAKDFFAAASRYRASPVGAWPPRVGDFAGYGD